MSASTLPTSDNLQALARLAQEGDRTQMAHSLIALLGVDTLTDKERHIAGDIMLRLLHEAETQLRQVLATRLATLPKCPVALVYFLIFDNPFPVAEPILRHSDALTDDMLIAIATRFQKTEYWETLAARHHLSAPVAELLSGFENVEVCTVLLNNHGAMLNERSMKNLSSMAQEYDLLQPLLLDRPEITAEIAHSLYVYASENLRNQITQRFGSQRIGGDMITLDDGSDILPFDTLDVALEDTIETLVYQRTEKLSKVKTVSADALDLRFKDKMSPKLQVRHLLDVLKKGHLGLYASMWAALTECDPDVLLHKIENHFASTHVILVHAMRMKRQDYNDLFFAWRQAHGHRITDGHDAVKVLQAFDRMDVNNAQGILKGWQTQKTP